MVLLLLHVHSTNSRRNWRLCRVHFLSEKPRRSFLTAYTDVEVVNFHCAQKQCYRIVLKSTDLLREKSSR